MIEQLITTVENKNYIRFRQSEKSWFTFYDNLNSDRIVLKFIDVLSNKDIEVLFDRCKELYKDKGNNESIHKWDIPLSIYLYILNERDKDKAVEIAELIYNTHSNCWWSSALSVKVLNKPLIIKAVTEDKFNV